MRTLWLLALLAAPAAADIDVGLQGRARQPGEVLLVVVKGADPQKVPTGSFEGKPLRFFEGKEGVYLAFLGLDLDLKAGVHALSLEIPSVSGAVQKTSIPVDVQPKAFATRELKVDDKYVSPPKADELRAAREAKMLAEMFAKSDGYRYFQGRFETPIAGATSSHFGERSVFNGVPKLPHSGADLKAKSGVRVRAPQGGKVVVAENLFYQGNCVFIDHGFGVISGYFHLSSIDVRVGDVVKKGQVVGRVGMTGRVTGPHLHWMVKSGSARVDPFSLTALDLDRWLPAPSR